jgi:hypothetical protein
MVALNLGLGVGLTILHKMRYETFTEGEGKCLKLAQAFCIAMLKLRVILFRYHSWLGR